MNEIFLDMIGGGEERSIIQEAKITNQYDIVVLGPNNRKLDPDGDLNGASRRALTMAFLFALEEVSEVSVPSVIDTPFTKSP